MTPTAARNLTCSLAPCEPERALATAKSINDPWFRCQALSWVGRYWPNKDYLGILKDAVSSANLQDNCYKRVAVSAWPIRAYLERGNPALAEKLIADQIQNARGIENLGGRSEALFALFQSAKPFDPKLWRPAFLALVDATEPALSWRQLRNMREALAMVIPDHPDLAEHVLQKVTFPRNVKAIRKLVEGELKVHASPRDYFRS